MGFLWEYLAHWSVLVMAAGLMILIGGMVALLVPVFRAIKELIKVRTNRSMTKAN